MPELDDFLPVYDICMITIFITITAAFSAILGVCAVLFSAYLTVSAAHNLPDCRKITEILQFRSSFATAHANFVVSRETALQYLFCKGVFRNLEMYIVIISVFLDIYLALAQFVACSPINLCEFRSVNYISYACRRKSYSQRKPLAIKQYLLTALLLFIVKTLPNAYKFLDVSRETNRFRIKTDYTLLPYGLLIRICRNR